MEENINPNQAKRILASKDMESGINTDIPIEEKKPKEKAEKPKSLGKAKAFESEISGAGDSHWKIVPMEFIPTKGMFYPEDSEITIRPATTGEIRHWSTIEEHDVQNIHDMLNFILEKCVRFKIKGKPVIFRYLDLCEVDRFYLIFRIHELTFPNGENQLTTIFACNSCNGDDKYQERRPITSAMLRLYELPDEVMDFYNSEKKCFTIDSKKLNETFNLYMPTLGTAQAIRRHINAQKTIKKPINKAFIKVLPYLSNLHTELMSQSGISKYYAEYNEWADEKFFFITKFAELIKKGKRQNLEIDCPKCGTVIGTNIFSRYSFVVKDLFFISSRLIDFI